MIGEETGQKTTADKVVEKMRTKHTVDGKKLFAPKDYLTREQITAAFSRMAKQYQTGKLTKPTQKDKQVEVELTFHENDEEYLLDNVETIIDEDLQMLTNELESFNTGDFVYVELKNKKKLKSKVCSDHFAGQIVNLDDNEVEISFLKNSQKYYMWPDPLSVSWVDVDDIHLKLDTPNMD